MDLSASKAFATHLEWIPETTSTNDDVVTRLRNELAKQLPHFYVLATDNQTQGKGRLGRTWSAPAGKALAVSVVLRPQTPAGRSLPPSSWGWFGLLSGLAMSRAVTSLLPGELTASLKWPNDVLVGSKKIAGVLSEMVETDAGAAVVVGVGVNLFLTEDELPVPTATSLALLGATGVSVDEVLSLYLQEFSRLTNVFMAAAGNARSSGIVDQVTTACSTIGARIRVELPSGENPVGTATGISDDGSLIVQVGECAEPLLVSAGDVTHIRRVDTE
jgi:BirA family biotin operon repressor/biotin-[acetyl-CoA-carboxylase] ligase